MYIAVLDVCDVWNMISTKRYFICGNPDTYSTSNTQCYLYKISVDFCFSYEMELLDLIGSATVPSGGS